MKLEALEKIHLGYYPTPIERLDRLAGFLGIQEEETALYIKRDDMTGPAFGGNKTRKLEYLMKEALDQGCTAALTYGGVQTNHGRTTVGACIKVGLKPILILYGKEPEYISGNLTLDYLMGADVYFLEDEAGLPRLKDEIYQKYEGDGDKIYDIPIGGSNELGGVGYLMAVREIMEQLRQEKIKLDYLICTVGSMGTFGGLVTGARYFGADFEVIGVPVWPEPKGKIEHQMAKYCNKVSEKYELGISFQDRDIKIAYGPDESPFSGEEYNKPDSVTRGYMRLLARTEAILLDPTYTGKTFRGFVELVQGGLLKGGKKAMFLHTGGGTAIWTKEHLDAMQEEIKIR